MYILQPISIHVVPVSMPVSKHVDNKHRGYEFEFHMYCNKNILGEEGNREPSHFPSKKLRAQSLVSDKLKIEYGT